MDIFQKCFSKPGSYLLLNSMIRLEAMQSCTRNCKFEKVKNLEMNRAGPMANGRNPIGVSDEGVIKMRNVEKLMTN